MNETLDDIIARKRFEADDLSSMPLATAGAREMRNAMVAELRMEADQLERATIMERNRALDNSRNFIGNAVTMGDTMCDFSKGEPKK